MVLLSAAGMASVFEGYRLLAWAVIASSDFHLFIVLLLAALQSDDENFLKRHRWITAFLPRTRTAGLLVVTLLFAAVISGFAGPYVGTEVFPVVKMPLDALYISSFTLALTDYSPKTWLWSTCSARSTRQQHSPGACTVSLAHLANLHFQTFMNA